MNPTDGQLVGLVIVIVLALVALTLYAAIEIRLARFMTPWEDTQWRWYKETGEWLP